METTIIKLGGTGNENLVVRSASFEEAFGEYSEAKGKGRARRKKRRLERIASRDETRKARQGSRLARREENKAKRQAIRSEQQQARLSRRDTRLAMRQKRAEAQQMRKDTRHQGKEGRENYSAEQEAYRENIGSEAETTTPSGDGATSQDQGGYAPQDQGGYAPQDQGGYAPQDQGGYAPHGGGGGGSQGQGGYVSDEDWATPPSGYDQQEEDSEEGAYGDDNTYEGDYVQEEDEFNDDSYFNVEGMDGKSIVSPQIKETAQKLKNNAKAYQVLKAKRQNAVANQNQTEGLDNLMNRTRARIVELKSNLDDYCYADGNPNESKRRKKEVNLALGRRLRKRRRKNQYAGSEVPVESDLNPQFGANRIEIPAKKSGFDAYSDLGRPVIIDGNTMSDNKDYTNDIYGDFEPTTIEMQSSFDGSSSNNKKLMSVAIGVGVGALALYLAKRQGWI